MSPPSPPPRGLPALASLLLVLLLAIGGCSGDPGASGADGKAGADARVNLVPEPAGENCSQGGVRIETGLDANSDGQLEASEVDPARTRYLCNGASGADGTDDDAPPTTLNRMLPEPAGDHCAEGGVRIDTGVDVDRNGLLDDGEVDPSLTEYVCQAVGEKFHYGDLTLTSPDQLSQLDGVEVVFGNLELLWDFNGSVSIPSLEVVTGNLRIGDPAPGLLAPLGQEAASAEAPTLSFPDLIQTKYIYVSSRSLAGLSMPALVQDGQIYISAPALSTLELPALETVTGLLYLSNIALTSLSLPALETANELLVQGSPDLQSLSAPSLRTTRLLLSSLPALATLDLPALERFWSSSQVADPTALSPCAVDALNLQVFLRGSSHYLTAWDEDDSTCDATQFCPFVDLGGTLQTYRQCVMLRSFDDARAVCQGLGGDLLSFDDASEQATVFSAIGNEQLFDASYLGFTDAAVEGTWAWIDGASYLPTGFWGGGEPNNGGGNEDCAVLRFTGKVNDIDCGLRVPFLCELPPAP